MIKLAGTVDITNGTGTVTGTGTAFVGSVFEGDSVSVDRAHWYRVTADPANNTTLTIEPNFAETTVNDGTLWLLPVAITRETAVGFSAAIAELINRQVEAFTLTGSDRRLTLNKATTGDLAEVLFETAGTTLARIGLLESDSYKLQVDANGGWADVMVATVTGTSPSQNVAVSFPRAGGVEISGPLSIDSGIKTKIATQTTIKINTDQTFVFTAHNSLADGVRIVAMDDALINFKGLELSASRFAVTGGNVGIGVAPGAGTMLQVAGRGLFTAGSSDPGDGTPAGVSISYDTENDYGVIEAIHTFTAGKDLKLQPSGGGVTIGNPTGGFMGAGTLNAVAVYDDNTILTCMGIEWLIDGRIDFAKWDVLAGRDESDPERAGIVNRLARRFQAMLDEGFDPRDPANYMARLRADRALPGMPTEEEWLHNATSVGELFTRLWLATELLAVAFDGHRQQVEARLAALEAH